MRPGPFRFGVSGGGGLATLHNPLARAATETGATTGTIPAGLYVVQLTSSNAAYMDR